MGVPLLCMTVSETSGAMLKVFLLQLHGNTMHYGVLGYSRGKGSQHIWDLILPLLLIYYVTLSKKMWLVFSRVHSFFGAYLEVPNHTLPHLSNLKLGVICLLGPANIHLFTRVVN